MDCMRDVFLEGALLDGRYKTLAPLNHGSFGMVFMAEDVHTSEVVAIKCLTKPAAASSCPSGISVDDRSEELVCHARLGSHSNIVNMIHHFESDAHLYLVLEFCSMGDLYEAIRLERGPRETDNVRDFMLQLVNAVEYMHSKGIAHRDIKPENIFLTATGDMKLGDFGLATAQSWSHETSVGSDRYMAPEQYDSAGHGYSPAQADIWAIGICLINLIFSRNPFATPSEPDLLFADYVRDNQSLFDIFPTMSQDMFEVLNHAMAVDPEKRSLAAVKDALYRVISFTTVDESLDDFCTEDRELVPPSANREPLRTPSIQSPPNDQGAFPWAKALRMSPPQQIRQLSAIPDTEEYHHDLPYGSHVSKEDEDWYSIANGPMSMASVLDSGLGASLKSLTLPKKAARHNLPRSEPMPITGSLPIVDSQALPAMTSVFGGKAGEMVSKSWSDLWDEDYEEEKEPEKPEEAFAPLQVESAKPCSETRPLAQDNDVTLRALDISSAHRSSVTPTLRACKSTDVLGFKRIGTQEDDVFFFEEHNPPRYSPPPRYTPPSRRDIMDKWAALGNRRRAYNNRSRSSSNSLMKDATAFTGGAGVKGSSGGRSEFGLGFSGFHGGVWDAHNKDNGVDGSIGEKIGSVGGEGVHSAGAPESEWVGGWHDLHL